jgi:NodT family efflux transporter outer membrane factor (OMF) lipoprotein
MMRTLQAVAAAGMLLAAGCSIGPDYARPPTAAPDQWKLAEPQAPVAWPAEDWWRGFRSPALDSYIALAQRNNYDIGAAASRVLQADAQVRIAGAALLPQVDANANVSRQRFGREIGGQSVTTYTTRYSASVAASYEVDFWGRNRATRASAEALAVASRFDRETVAITVLANVALTYFQALEALDRLAIARENLANAERVMALVEARAAAGAASALEIAQQRAVVAAQRATIPTFEQQVQLSENALAILLGQPPSAVRIAAGSLDDIALPEVSPGLPSELLTRRPDIGRAEVQLVAANADIKAARAAFFPSIPLTANYGYESLALSSLFTPTSLFYGAVASLTQPIFTGGRLTGQTELTEARYEELALFYRQAVISAFADVEDALATSRQSTAQQRLQEDAVAQAQIAFDLADARYRAGAVDLLVVLDAQRTLFQARDLLAQVKSARLQSVVTLFRALGGGWQGALPETE